jgi:hypothetical protein
MAKFIDMTGKRIGRWTVLRKGKTDKHVFWICECDCGNVREVAGSSLRKQGKYVSCGCYAAEQSSARLIDHGLSHTAEWRVWQAMHHRCENPTNVGFDRYGGRGITVCERWQTFEPFLEDMGEHPGKGYSLDRIDNEQGYSKENCRWATKLEQANNTSTNVYWTLNGETRSISDWARHYNLRPANVHRRLQCGWDLKRALTEPLRVWPSQAK